MLRRVSYLFVNYNILPHTYSIGRLFPLLLCSSGALLAMAADNPQMLQSSAVGDESSLVFPAQTNGFDLKSEVPTLQVASLLLLLQRDGISSVTCVVNCPEDGQSFVGVMNKPIYLIIREL